ncbi:hypothetical protein PsYK624_134830 [Phanerochaete sordida]|uniref:Uncharacterized protein n=1 Tax=Phanerochaete sordida TaxID=48140 RepID=A0A9P3GKP0_9APHY|nr:hypothetical protein PsYK624_134830 [Phanerochaete sordida]
MNVRTCGYATPTSGASSIPAARADATHPAEPPCTSSRGTTPAARTHYETRSASAPAPETRAAARARCRRRRRDAPHHRL